MVLLLDQINTVTVKIINTLTKAIELFTLMAKLSPQSKLKWTEKYTQVIKTKQYAYKHFNKHLTEDNHITLQIAKQEKDKTIKKATKMEHRNRVSKVKDIKGF